jgi:PEP-CTERM/exosortase A-associated glycosyltransferase
MRILHVLDHSIPLHSGYTFRTLAILKAQRQLGWETAHVTGAKHVGASAAVEEVNGLTFYRTGPWGGRLATLPVVNQFTVIQGLARRLREVVAEVRPDILHAHSPSLNGIAAVRVARSLGLPMVYEVRALWEDGAVDHGTGPAGGARYWASRVLETRVFGRADAVTTICEGLRKEIEGRGVTKLPVTVIPNAVDLAEFSVGGSKNVVLARSLGLDGKRVLGFIGSFYAYEGLSLLLDTLPLMLSQASDVRILLVGGGPEEARLKQQAQRLGIAAQVVFAGRVPHAMVPEYYNLADAMIYPRLRTRVTELVTPLKPLEAMAQGRLVVASDVGGQMELIRNGVTGLLFRAGDAGSLAETALGALKIASHLEIREAARRFVEQERTWSGSVGRYEAVYLRALGKLKNQ